MADDWSSSWRDPPTITEEEADLIQEAKDCLKEGEDYEAEFRVRFDYDYKFANGDTHNKYQWENELVLRREDEDKPVLTINKVAQHNLLIINDSKQNKSGVRVRPVNDEASFEGASLYQELIYHVEYISGAENVYDSAIVWQVEAGKGYWIVTTEFMPKSMNQEIYIRMIKDPRCVYLDPNTNTPDKDDARWGLLFEDVDKKLFKKKYPKFASVGASVVLGSSLGTVDSWITDTKIKVVQFYKKEEIAKKLVSFINPQGAREEGYFEDLSDEGKEYYKQVKNHETSREREEIVEKVKIYKIAGDRIIEKSEWPGSTIPIVALPGVETVIDGIYDCRGHTRALINPQQMYNWNSSANIEFGALQTKSPYIAASAAIEGFEEYYKTANSTNHSYMPYNQYDEDGNKLDAPQRAQAPQPGTAYIESMKIAQNELMMASGQWQSQVGENENAKSGVAINARQRQGDRATYHFIDNQAIAIRRTGKILIELIPKVYDTKRVKKIIGRDGTKKHIILDPDFADNNGGQSVQKMPNLNLDQDISKQIEQYVLDPTVGMYDIQSDTGPSFATKRQEGSNALTQIAAQNKEFMNVAGDIYFKMMDFPDADVLAERYHRMIPPNITGDAPNPQQEALMHQAADQIHQLQGAVAVLNQKLEDKSTELDIKLREIALEEKKVAVEQQRLDYEAETKRVTALGNSGPGISVEQIQPVLRELLSGMIANGELVYSAPGPHQGGKPIMLPETNGGASSGQNEQNENEQPPVPGAAKAPDGRWYVAHPQGGFAQVQPQ